MELKDYSKDPRIVKKMATLLMQGAAMLQDTCPLDGLPLFKLRTGEIVCPVHGRVLIVSSEREARELEVEEILHNVEYEASLRLRNSLDDPNTALDLLKIIHTIEVILKTRMERRMPGEREKCGKEGKGG